MERATEPSVSGGRALCRRVAVRLEQIGDMIHAVKYLSHRRLCARKSSGQLRRVGQAALGIRLLDFFAPNHVPINALGVVFYTEATLGSLVIALGFLGPAATTCGLSTFEPFVAPRTPERSSQESTLIVGRSRRGKKKKRGTKEAVIKT